MNQNQVVKTTELATNHHKRWWCGMGLLRTGQWVALQPISRGCGTHQIKSQKSTKIHKNQLGGRE